MITALINPDNYSFTYHALGVFASGVCAFLFGIMVLLHERSRVGVRNWFFSIAETLWLVCFGLAYASRTDDLALTWFVIGDIGIVFLPAALLALNASILQRDRELRLWVRACFLLSLLFAAALLGSRFFITGLLRYPWGPAPAYGPIGILFVCYAILVGGASLVFFYRAYQDSIHPRFRARHRGFLVSALIGYPAYVDFLPKLGFPVYPAGYIAIIAYMLYASRIVLKYRLVDITAEVATRQILETMQGAVIVEDLEGKVRVVNRIAQEMLGHGRDELVGTNLAEVFPTAVDLRRMISSGDRTASEEFVWTGRDGQRYEMDVSASILADERDGTRVGVVYVAHDITKRKQAEERLTNYSIELREANKKLEALDRLKSEFVSTVSHEFRTPLTSIKANAELILMKPELQDNKKQRLLVTINEESDRLTRLINDLLDLSRIEAGTAYWRRAEVAMDSILRLSIDAVLPLIQQKGLSLETAIAGPLPVVIGDRDRLIQVMNNLLSNAIKFTPPGGSISVEAGQDGPHLIVSVHDTGAGIPAEEIDVVFDKFHRSRDQANRKTEGTGLGLAIARQIVVHHGGTIRVSSTYGAGTTMIVTLPAGRTREPGPGSGEEAPAAQP